MSNEVVKYHNDLNTVPMRNWTSEEMNFFFAIIAKLRDVSTREIQFDKQGLTELSNYSLTHNKRFEETMENLVKKISQIHYIERTSNSLELMNLFSRFRVDWSNDLSDMTATVKVTEEFEYVVNRLNVEFTSYELEEFTLIRSTYAKTVYRLLKQWRTIGKREFSLDELKRLLDTPDYYLPSHIDKNILKPVMRELPQFFPGLKIKKVKDNTRGNPVKSYIFTWKSEKSEKWIDGKYDKKSMSSGKVVRKEKLPEWAKEDYIQPKETMLSKEKQDELNERLARIRSN
ncbi:replication initiation protein [Carnobacterium mobile]|uniref:replication initiation protein n=3 Tax=Carnobacterium mobile TaxID=2750 RepID=UPI0009FF283F|nr:replication initiation protein [Carnobacterium mobile]